MRLVLILVSFGPVLAGADSASPVQVGSRLELFVDEYLIESMDGVRLQLQKPLPAGTVMKHDKPWEGTTSAYHTVFQDGDIFPHVLPGQQPRRIIRFSRC